MIGIHVTVQEYKRSQMRLGKVIVYKERRDPLQVAQAAQENQLIWAGIC